MPAPSDLPLTWMPDRSKLERPVYLSLARQLENDIRAGLLPPGTRLPAQRELADALGIHFTTVTRTYSLCTAKGLVHAQAGSGTFVSPRSGSSVTITAAARGVEIDLAFVASFEQCNAMLQESVRAAASKKYFARLFDYEHPDGMPHHKNAGRLWLHKLGFETDNDHLVLVSGALNALSIALLALFRPGMRIALDEYSFPNFIELARQFGLQLEAIAADEEGMRPDLLEARLKSREIHGLYLMPSCCNPTTTVMSEQRKRELAALVARHGLLLLEDETQAFLTVGEVPSYEGPLARLVPEQTISISSVSKSLGSGLRVAYMVCPEQYRAKILRTLYNTNVKTSSFNAEIVTELIHSGRARDIIQAKKKLAAEANALFDRHFGPCLPFQHPLSYYRWLELVPASPQAPEIPDGPGIEEALRERGVLVYHSYRFASARTGSAQRQFVRVALSTAETLSALDLGLGLLRDGLTQLQLVPMPAGV